MTWQPEKDEQDEREEQQATWLNRDDPEQMRYFHLCVHVKGGYPRSQDVLDRFIKEHTEKLQQGDVNYLTMGGFNASPRCPKCGTTFTQNRNFHVHYIPEKGAEIVCPEHAGVREHLHRCCPECSYSWAEKCLSEEEHGYHIPAAPH